MEKDFCIVREVALVLFLTPIIKGTHRQSFAVKP